jgi:hypothetical protein
MIVGMLELMGGGLPHSLGATATLELATGDRYPQKRPNHIDILVMVAGPLVLTDDITERRERFL